MRRTLLLRGAVALCIAAGVAAQPPAGIERDGRIPRAELPADLPNPDRWRYVPEGRLVEGNVFERFLISSFVVPIVFFESDVGAGGGLSITDIDFRNQRRQEFAGIFLSHTTEGQQRYSIVWQRWLHHRELAAGGVALEERSLVRARAGYARTLTRRFFGLGPRTRESDETSFTDEVTGVGLRLDATVPEPGSDLVCSVGVGVEHRNLSRGRVSSVPSTERVFPALVAAGDDRDSLIATASVRYDTRDSQHNPYRGWSVAASAFGYPLQTGGDSGAVLRASATGVLPVPPLFHDGGDGQEENPPTDTVAVHGFVEDTSGDLPFWALPSLGGSYTLRGFVANRWTDEAAWHSALEYRFWVVPRGVQLTRHVRIERLGLAVFGEAGAVAAGIDELTGAQVRWSGGFSFRATLERLALFRADVGFSEDGLNLTIRYGLSF